MYLSRRQLLGTGAIGFVTLAAAACSTGKVGTASGGTTTLEGWDFLSESLSGEALAQSQTRDKFVKLNPKIAFERRAVPFDTYKQLIVQSASGGGLPDYLLCDAQDTAAFASLGILADLTSRAEKWGQLDSFFPSTVDNCMYDGKLWGLPDNVSALALVVNDDLLEAAGVAPPTTWDELRATAKALTKDGVQGFAFAAKANEQATFQFEPFLWSEGGDLDQIDSPGSQRALQRWVDLVADGSVSEGVTGYDQGELLNQFLGGNIAMMMNGPWFYSNLSGSDLRWSVHQLPAGSEGVVSVTGGANTVALNGDNVQAVWDYFAFKEQADISAEQCRTGGVLPPRQDAIAQEPWTTDPALSAWTEALKVARPRNYGPKYPEMSQSIQQMIQAVLTGSADVKTATAKAATELEPFFS
jgi:multiple sugar transport system substrate-binding protein